jgi:hypothetical protein
MGLSRARLLAASAVALAIGVGAPVVVASSASAATSPGYAATAAAAPAVTASATGTFKDPAGTGTFSGTFAPISFSVVHGIPEATGRLAGTLTRGNGTPIGHVSQTITLPVHQEGASAAVAADACSVLNLALGPFSVNLHLAGLVVALNQVHLTITADPDSLTGNLLCVASRLLHAGGGLLSDFSSLLNKILSLL